MKESDLVRPTNTIAIALFKMHGGLRWISRGKSRAFQCITRDRRSINFWTKFLTWWVNLTCRLRLWIWTKLSWRQLRRQLRIGRWMTSKLFLGVAASRRKCFIGRWPSSVGVKRWSWINYIPICILLKLLDDGFIVFELCSKLTLILVCLVAGTFSTVQIHGDTLDLARVGWAYQPFGHSFKRNAGGTFFNMYLLFWIGNWWKFKNELMTTLWG